MKRLYLSIMGNNTKEKSEHLKCQGKSNQSFLKTVSAFANCEGGDIVFNFENDPQIECLNISKLINNSIVPMPRYTLRISKNKTITLHIDRGLDTPYKFKGRSYVRNGSCTILASSIQEKKAVFGRK